MILRDDDAEAWFSARGLAGTGLLEVSVDERRLPHLRLTRTWHSPASGLLVAPPRSLLLVLQLDADISIAPFEQEEETGDPTLISAGESFALLNGQQARMTAATASARIEIEVPAGGDLLPPHHPVFPSALWPRSGRSWPHAALISLTNVVLNLDPTTELTDASRLTLAIRSCLEAFASQSESRAIVTAPSSARRLMMRVREAVENRASDPDFTVDELASEVGVTRAYLWRVITAEVSLTPRELLRAVRRRAALDLLEKSREEVGGSIDMEAVARTAGFGSRNALRRALDASGTEPLPW